MKPSVNVDTTLSGRIEEVHMMFSRKRLAFVGAVIATVAIAVPVALSAVTSTGTLSHFDKQMHNRLFRDAVPQDCHGTKLNPGIFDDGGAIRSYDKYTFKNTSSVQKCGHVVMNQLCFSSNLGGDFNAFVQANAPFNITDPSLNWLGDAGSSDTFQSFAFPVAAGQSFDVVVGNVDNEAEGASLPCPYAITVTLGGVQQPPAAAAVVHPAGTRD